ncbi:MAG: carboxypeptidase-like regulatory domain-containing protein [Bryobacteraceae bacterium]
MFKFGAFVLLLASSVPAAFAARPTTEIRIEVKDPRGRPVERAAVILDFLTAHHQVFKLGKREAKHWELRTNLEGVAHFPPIPQGTIRVQVIAKDFQTFGENVDIDQGQKTLQVTLNPPQKQYSVYGPGADSSEHQGPPPH